MSSRDLIDDLLGVDFDKEEDTSKVDELESLSDKFNELLGMIPIADDGTREREVAVEVIGKLKSTFAKVSKEERAERTSMGVKSGKRGGSKLPDAENKNRSKSINRDELLIKALDKFSQALELLNDKSDKGAGLPNSGSSLPWLANWRGGINLRDYYQSRKKVQF